MDFIRKKDKVIDISLFFSPVKNKIIVALCRLKPHVEQLVFYLGGSGTFAVERNLDISFHTVHVMIRIDYEVLNHYDSALASQFMWI